MRNTVKLHNDVSAEIGVDYGAGFDGVDLYVLGNRVLGMLDYEMDGIAARWLRSRGLKVKDVLRRDDRGGL